jgi:hypothetical protein
MTVNPAVRMWSGDEGESALSDNLRSLDLQTSETYAVTCTPDETLLNILNASGLPTPGQLYPGTTNVYAHKAKGTRQSPVLWLVVVPYKGYVSNFGPAIVDWSNVTVEEEIDEDFDGNPILTEAGEPVEGIRALFCDPVATIRKNMLTYNSYVGAVYHRSVNSDTFLGWPPGTCKLMDLNAKDVNGSYYEVTGTFQFRIPYRTTAAKAWYSRWRHEGFQRKVDAYGTTVIAPVVDDLMEASSTKQLLDANGYQIFSGAGSAVWKETKKYASLPYSALGFF